MWQIALLIGLAGMLVLLVAWIQIEIADRKFKRNQEAKRKAESETEDEEN